MTKVYDCQTRISHKYVVQAEIAMEYVGTMYFRQSCKNCFPVPNLSENVGKNNTK